MFSVVWILFLNLYLFLHPVLFALHTGTIFGRICCLYYRQWMELGYNQEMRSMSAVLVFSASLQVHSPPFSTCSISPCQAVGWQWLSFYQSPNSYPAAFSCARSYCFLGALITVPSSCSCSATRSGNSSSFLLLLAPRCVHNTYWFL